jgi:hypothetical protein
MSPSQQVEIEYFFYGTNTDSYRLQGTNYRWSPTPQSLKYYFRHVVDNTTTYYIGPGGSSGTVTSNPATSTKLPGVSTYVNIDPAGSNYSVGVLNSYNFEVRATGASGTVYPSISAPFEFRSPKAPTLSFQANTSTSVTLTITASSLDDYYATGRYILYTYDGTSGYVYSGGGRGGFSPTSSSMTKSLTGLVSGRSYVVYVLPVTGTTGTTPSNYSGYPGVEAYLSGVTAGTAAATSPTSITAANNGSYTTVSISWSGASNAVYYRVRWVGYQDTSVDPSTYYDKQITAVNSTSGSWNWGPSDPDKDGAVPYPGTAYYYHVSSSADGTNWSTYTVSATAVGTYVDPAPTIISAPVNTNTSGTRNFSVTTGSWNNSPVSYSYQWKAFTYLPYPPYTSTINVGTNSSSYSGISTYDNYSIYCDVTATNAGGSSSPSSSNSITQVAPVVNLTPPSIYYVAAGNAGGPVTAYFSGGSGPYYQIWWSSGGAGSSYDEYGYGSPITDNTGPGSAGTWYMYVRSVSSLTNVGTGPSPTISAWSSAYAFTVTSAAPATAPGTPATPANGWTGGTAYPFSWSAPSAGTVSGGGAASISYYNLYIYEATNSSGSGYYQINSYTVYGTSFNYTSPNAAKYYACQVSATNTAGLTGGLSGFSAYK